MLKELFDEKNEKENEKIKRERNRLLLEKKSLINDIQKREKVLETLDAYLKQRIEKLKKAKISETAIHELELLLEGLKEERETIKHRQELK